MLQNKGPRKEQQCGEAWEMTAVPLSQDRQGRQYELYSMCKCAVEVHSDYSKPTEI